MLGRNIQFHPVIEPMGYQLISFFGMAPTPSLENQRTALQIWRRTTPWRRWTSCCGEPSCGAAMRRQPRRWRRKTKHTCFFLRNSTEKRKRAWHSMNKFFNTWWVEIAFWTLDPNPWFGLNGSKLRFVLCPCWDSGPSSKMNTAPPHLRAWQGGRDPVALHHFEKILADISSAKKSMGKCHTGGNEGWRSGVDGWKSPRRVEYIPEYPESDALEDDFPF